MLTSFAPAKVNLYLHITGKRADGYHLLDSLVVFCDAGDTLTLEKADAFSFEIVGPLSAGLNGEDPEKNLVVRAARALATKVGKPLNVKLTLTKNLPVASGIGGGSSDAAAALRLVAQHLGVDVGDPMLFEIAQTLGADVPCCVAAKTCYFNGTGETTDPGPDLGNMGMLLVNPRQALATASVFKARTGAFSPAARLTPAFKGVEDFVQQLKTRHNDLQPPAESLLPMITEILTAIEKTPECLLWRMSGSGATCFGLYKDVQAAQKAATLLSAIHPQWWVSAAKIPA